MDKRLLPVIALLFCLTLLGAGCQKSTSISPVPSNLPETKSSATILISNEDANKYCNGVDMDSEGYRKTITQEKIIDLPKGDLAQAELAKAVILAATSGMCRSAMQELEFKVENGTVHIPPIEGWAGVSIAMCSCRPQIEVNLLRLPGIQKVIWDQ